MFVFTKIVKKVVFEWNISPLSLFPPYHNRIYYYLSQTGSGAMKYKPVTSDQIYKSAKL